MLRRVEDRAARTAAIWVLLLGVLAGPAACSKSEPPPASASEAAFAVEGMTCASCTVTVSTAAKRVDGVYGARANVDQARAWATYDARRTNPAAIAAAITEAGYKANPLSDPRRSTTGGTR